MDRPPTQPRSPSADPSAGPSADPLAGPPARILLVDDDHIILDSLGGFLRLEGYDVTAAETIPQAMHCLQAGRFNLVLTDVNMPTSDGMALLRHIKAHFPDLVVILITGYGTIESAVEAMKMGAYDYLTKPIIDDDVRLSVQRALYQQRLLDENRQLRQALSNRYSFQNILSTDPRMAKVFDLVQAVSDSRTTVLLTGESGTGKSLVARVIHSNSPQRDKPLVEVACGALPDTLLESELFGHVRGAFTHALYDKQGKFAAADGGTIFLDEVATASPQLQIKLLRVLQERRFEPVGSNRTVEVDVRVILATHHDLEAEVAAGRFREDLYYRVNVVNIHLPPLRERVGDIPVLAEHFLQKNLAARPRQIKGFSSEAMELMLRHPWPGNIRELENCVERAVVLCRASLIGPEDLPPALLANAPQPPATSGLPPGSALSTGSAFPIGCGLPAGSGPAASSGISPGSSFPPGPALSAGTAISPGSDLPPGAALAAGQAVPLKQALSGPEKEAILAALRANHGNRQATAKQLGIERTTLYKKMKKYGLLGK